MWHELASQRRLQEAQGPVVLEAVEDVPDELDAENESELDKREDFGRDCKLF